MNKRLAWTLAGYAVLTALAVYLLHGKVLWAVLILYGYFGARTLIADKIRAQQDSIRDGSSQSETPDPGSEPESGKF